VMPSARRVAALFTMTMAAACGGTTVETASRVEPTLAPAAPVAPAPTLAERVEVDNIAVLQGTTVTLVEGATSKKKRNAPVIAGRPALVRVHARSLDAKGRLPKLGAELRVSTPGKADVVVREAPKPMLTLDDSDLDSTFNFELDAAVLAPASALSVTLADPSAADDLATFPTDGTTFAIGARDIEAHRRALYTMYPTRTVEIDVRAPLPWPSAVEATGQGWDELLNAIVETRRTDLVDDDVFYVGVFTPKASVDEYCGNGGCILGVAPAACLTSITNSL
jgi:hypothetical protein